MEDWRAKLAGLNQELSAKERAVAEAKADVLKGFRKRLTELEAVAKNAVEFGDAFGADCDYQISRFDERYPYLRFRIKRPVMEYEVICRDGVIYQRIQEGAAAPKMTQVKLDTLTAQAVEQRLTKWVQAAADTNRKVPGKR
jgi:hypothetical protein